MSQIATATAAVSTVATFEERRRTADRIFRGALLFNIALTVFWLFSLLTHHRSVFFQQYQIDGTSLLRVIQGILIFNVFWGFIWYGVKAGLLKLAGFSKEELRQIFSSRMQQPFDVSAFVARHSERRIRIADMIGRRGRFLTLGFAVFFYMYSRQAGDPSPRFATFFLSDSLFEAVLDRMGISRVLLKQRVSGCAVLRPSVADHGWRTRARQLPADHHIVGNVQVYHGPFGRQTVCDISSRSVCRSLRHDLGLLHGSRWTIRSWRSAFRETKNQSARHRRRKSQVHWRNRFWIRRLARTLPLGRLRPTSSRALDRTRDCYFRLKLFARIVLTPRYRRFRDGHRERAYLLGLWSFGLLILCLLQCLDWITLTLVTTSRLALSL
jgi:hypothetical protein